jgi:hypothetical protein
MVPKTIADAAMQTGLAVDAASPVLVLEEDVSRIQTDAAGKGNREVRNAVAVHIARDMGRSILDEGTHLPGRAGKGA